MAAQVGTSLGCAIIWSYVELFGADSLGKLVFVDQARAATGAAACPGSWPRCAPRHARAAERCCCCCGLAQAPSQWRLPDWDETRGSKGIYDAPSLARIQSAVSSDMEAFAAGNAACCLTHTLPPALMATLTAETLKCNPAHLGKLMADHAPRDWRPILPRIGIPCLNLYGERDAAAQHLRLVVV